MSERKEVEPVIPRRPPRDRVVNHLRAALSVGVASVMVTGTTSCIVSDPLPRPSACGMGSPAAGTTVTTARRSGLVEVTIVPPSQFIIRAEPFITAGGVITQVFTSASSVVTVRPTGGPIELNVSYRCSDDSLGDVSVGVRLRPVFLNRPDAGTRGDGGVLPDGGLVEVPDDYAVDIFDP